MRRSCVHAWCHRKAQRSAAHLLRTALVGEAGLQVGVGRGRGGLAVGQGLTAEDQSLVFLPPENTPVPLGFVAGPDVHRAVDPGVTALQLGSFDRPLCLRQCGADCSDGQQGAEQNGTDGMMQCLHGGSSSGLRCGADRPQGPTCQSRKPSRPGESARWGSVAHWTPVGRANWTGCGIRIRHSMVPIHCGVSCP